MLKPELISARLHQASPEGRLDRLGAILRDMLDNGEDVDAHHLTRHVDRAESAWRDGRITEALLYIEKAEHVLTLLDYVGDPDRIVGKKCLEGARAGAEARKSDITKKVLSEMKQLISRGRKISWAAKTVHARGFGTSAEANRQLWNRHR